MSIATSIEKLSETLTNCKANLKEKEVADVDNIKISDVDEKIAEIQAGGGGDKFGTCVDFHFAPDGISDFTVFFNDDNTHNVEVTLNSQYWNSVSTLYAVNLPQTIKVQGVKGDRGKFTFSNISNQMDEMTGVVAISERDGYEMPEPNTNPPFIQYKIVKAS